MITILLFAHLQEELGKDRLELELEELSVKRLKKLLVDKYNLSKMEQVMTAINEEYALDDDSVKSGDVVAFIPPVSGG